RRSRRASGPATTVKLAVPVAVPSVAVTVWTPALPAEQLAPVHEPSGVIVNVAAAVRSPRSTPSASKPSSLNDCDAPATMLALAGVSARWSSGPGAYQLMVTAGSG